MLYLCCLNMHLTSKLLWDFEKATFNCPLSEIVTKHIEFQSSGRVLCNVKAPQNEVGKEETTEDGKPQEGKSNELLTKICYCIRPDHRADTVIHNIHVKDSLSDSIKFQQEKWGWNSPQLISQKISHMSFVGHNNQVSCCRVLSIWKKITLMIQNTMNPCYMIFYQYATDNLNF